MRQIIICVETTKDAKTDAFYIDKTIKYYYHIGNIKISYVYCNGKGNYCSKKVIDKIDMLKRNANANYVVFAFDTDMNSTSVEDNLLNDKIENYCLKNKYSFVWFCRDIEEVFLHQKIDKKDKIKMAKKFGSDYFPKSLTPNLSSTEMSKYKSNILLVFDKLLTRK